MFYSSQVQSVRSVRSVSQSVNQSVSFWSGKLVSPVFGLDVLWMVDLVCVYTSLVDNSFLLHIFCFVFFLTRLHVPDTVVASDKWDRIHVIVRDMFATCLRQV